MARRKRGQRPQLTNGAAREGRPGRYLRFNLPPQLLKLATENNRCFKCPVRTFHRRRDALACARTDAEIQVVSAEPR